MTSNLTTNPQSTPDSPRDRDDQAGQEQGLKKEKDVIAPSMENDVTGTLEEHWRKGIPTLILLCLAALISSYYWLMVKPAIQNRYSAIIQTNLKDLGLDVAENIQPIANPDDPNAELSLQKQIEKLKETQLSLRRLVGWNPSDDSVHYRYAIVSSNLSKCYQREAFASGNDSASPYLGIAKTEQQNATGAMERVRKLNNSYAPKASLWLVTGKIEENFAMSASDLLLTENAVRPLLENESIASSAKGILAQILIERALRHSSGLDLKKRLELLQQADEMLRTVAATDLLSLGNHAEAIEIADRTKGKEFANQALQVFWATRDSETLSARTLASVFRCLLIIDSLKEGQVFLAEQLKQIPAIDQPKFRLLAAAAALRHLMTIAIKVSSSTAATADRPVNARGTNNPSSAEIALSLAIQLAPESPELLEMFQAVAIPENGDPITEWMKKEFAMKKETTVAETGIAPFTAAVIGLGRGDLGETTNASLGNAIKLSPAYGVVASRLVMQMALSDLDLVSPETAIGWLRAINTISPDVLIAWSDRANLHLKYKQPAEAIECLQYLLEKLPGNAQIVEALDAAKAQLKIAE